MATIPTLSLTCNLTKTLFSNLLPTPSVDADLFDVADNCRAGDRAGRKR